MSLTATPHNKELEGKAEQGPGDANPEPHGKHDARPVPPCPHFDDEEHFQRQQQNPKNGADDEADVQDSVELSWRRPGAGVGVHALATGGKRVGHHQVQDAGDQTDEDAHHPQGERVLHLPRR